MPARLKRRNFHRIKFISTECDSSSGLSNYMSNFFRVNNHNRAQPGLNHAERAEEWRAALNPRLRFSHPSLVSLTFRELVTLHLISPYGWSLCLWNRGIWNTTAALQLAFYVNCPSCSLRIAGKKWEKSYSCIISETALFIECCRVERFRARFRSAHFGNVSFIGLRLAIH
jgi:hypothetical protein